MHGPTFVVLEVLSGRSTRTVVVVPQEDRPNDLYRDNTMIKGVTEVGELHIRTTTYSNDFRFLEEFSENTGFSMVYVSYQIEGEYPTEFTDTLKADLAELAFVFARQFISVYRFVSKHVDAFVPAPSDSPIVRIRAAKTYEFSEHDVAGDFIDIARNFSMPAAPHDGVGKIALSDDGVIELRRRLREGAQLHVVDELFLEARELSLIRGNHRLSVVTSGTAFEAWLQWRIIDEFRLREITHYPANEPEPLDTKIPMINLAPLFQRYVKHLVGIDVTKVSEYATWNNDAYTPRNEIIHRGRVVVSADDAQKAINSMPPLMGYLDALFASTRPAPP